MRNDSYRIPNSYTVFYSHVSWREQARGAKRGHVILCLSNRSHTFTLSITLSLSPDTRARANSRALRLLPIAGQTSLPRSFCRWTYKSHDWTGIFSGGRLLRQLKICIK